MNVNASDDISSLLSKLHQIARREDQAAANEAAGTPYWAAYSESVVAHRAAARALREEISRLEQRLRHQGLEASRKAS